MRKFILIDIVLSIPVLCGAEILQIDFSGYLHTIYSQIPVSGYYYNSVSGTIIYDTELLGANECFAQNDPYWEWKCETNQTVYFDIELTHGSSPDLDLNNRVDFPYGMLSSCTSYYKIEEDNLIGPDGQPHDFIDAIKDDFDVAYQDTNAGTGIVRTMKAHFSDGRSMAPRVDPFEPLIVFDPIHYDILSNPYSPSNNHIYGYFSMDTSSYDEFGEKEYHSTYYFQIKKCEVTVIPEPATALLLALGGCFLRKRDKYLLRRVC